MTDSPEAEKNESESAARTPFEDFLCHQRRALEETGKALEALLPEGFRTHTSNASKEFTEGFRVLIDAAVSELKKATSHVEPDEAGETEGGKDDPKASSTGKAKVKIPVD